MIAREPAEPSPAPAARWLVGILGGTDQRGRWRLSRRLRIVALLGGVSADLGHAQVEGPESEITVLAALGGVSIKDRTPKPGLAERIRARFRPTG